MGRAGILGEDERVELLGAEFIVMAAMGVPPDEPTSNTILECRR